LSTGYNCEIRNTLTNSAPVRYIYIDLGTNDGKSVDAFLPTITKTTKLVSQANVDGSLIANSAFFSSTREKVFANDPKYIKANYEIYAVEANPRFTEVLLDQKRNYTRDKISKSYTLYNATGISTRNGVGELILDCHGCQGDAGSTLSSDSLSAFGIRVPIRLLDIMTLLKEVRTRRQDFVFIKMDIEGLEYDIVRKLIATGMLAYQIDKIAVEWHHTAPYVFGHPWGNSSSEDYIKRLAIHNKYLKLYESIHWICSEEIFKDKFINWG